MKYRIFVFIYSGNEFLLPGLIRNVQWAFPGTPIHLVDDAASPIGGRSFPNGVVYEQSSFRRQGNLNGPECINGELDVFLKHLRMDETLIKIDPDIVFYNPGKMRRFIEAGQFAFASAQSAELPFSGYFYMMHARVLGHVVPWIRGNPYLLQSAPEDVLICSAALSCCCMLKLPAKILFDSSRLGATGAFDHGVPDEERPEYIGRLVNAGMFMHTLGNPGVTNDQLLKAQQAILAGLERLNETTLGTGTNDNNQNRKAEDYGKL